MTEPHRYPEDRRPVHHDGDAAAVSAPTSPEMPNFATTDVDPIPGSPRPFIRTEPNFATTDIATTLGSPRPEHVAASSGSTAGHPTGGHSSAGHNDNSGSTEPVTFA